MGMNSSISFRRYQKQYDNTQNYPIKEYRIKRNSHQICFKIYDINMSEEKSSNPDDFFKIYEVVGKKKVLLACDSLF